jgi:hypothetical protein
MSLHQDWATIDERKRELVLNIELILARQVTLAIGFWSAIDVTEYCFYYSLRNLFEIIFSLDKVKQRRGTTKSEDRPELADQFSPSKFSYLKETFRRVVGLPSRQEPVY